MGLKPAKSTFLNSAGRLGAPSARKPIAKKITKSSAHTGAYAMGKKTNKRPIGKAKVVPMSKKLKTGKMKGTLNSFRMSKQTPMPKRGTQDRKNSNFYMSKRPKGSNPKQDNIDKRLSSYFMSKKASY